MKRNPTEQAALSQFDARLASVVLVTLLCGVTHPGALLRPVHGGAKRLVMGGTAQRCHQRIFEGMALQAPGTPVAA